MNDIDERLANDLVVDHHRILGTTDHAGADRLAESLARIGVLLESQRVELFRRSDDEYSLIGWWTALGHGAEVDPVAPYPVQVSWFPWSLGHVRPTESLFVRNGGSQPTRPGGGRRMRNLGMGSAVCLPLADCPGDVGPALGAVCAYWATERPDWPADRGEAARDLGRDALLDS